MNGLWDSFAALGISREGLSSGLSLTYLALLTILCLYALHRIWLLLLFQRYRNAAPPPSAIPTPWPRITVQLPIYNEPAVAARVIDAVCALDYPRDRLQVQVLDDSDDGSLDISRLRVEHWRAQGVDIELRHRRDRDGYKAGALDEGLRAATGEFIAIFDADFAPPRDFLRQTLPFFAKPNVGAVQAKWSYLNRDASLLTRCQAVFLDAHFVLEHTARNRAGAWINFNGTAGIWRRAAIDAAGGWRRDALTEDLDLSYRAHLAGWRFVYLPQVECPSELPPQLSGFKSQQHRWTKGTTQVALRLLLPVLTSRRATWLAKLEAFAHLTSPLVYLCTTLVAVLLYPVIELRALDDLGRSSWGLVLASLFVLLGIAPAVVFYVASQSAQRRSIASTIALVPALLALGVGISLNNALACLEALLGQRSPFIRTPKYGDTSPGRIAGSKPWVTALELTMGVYILACIRLAIESGAGWIGVFFLTIFAAGYLTVGGAGLLAHLSQGRRTDETASATAAPVR